MAALQDAGKTVVEFPGIMPNPTYEKVQEGARIAREAVSYTHLDVYKRQGYEYINPRPNIILQLH